MPASPGQEFARRAVELARESPTRPAIEILDLAMSTQGERQPSGGAGELSGVHLGPPSPFAELLRRAFAPGMDPRELSLIALRGHSDAPDLQAAIDNAADRWQAVMELFAERYRLWERGSSPSPRTPFA